MRISPSSIAKAYRLVRIPATTSVMGVPETKLIQFGHFNSRAIQPAIAEINQTSRLTLTAMPRKVGRTVVSVTITWNEKPFEQKREAKQELDRSKVGRKARREGTTEIPPAAFPEIGSIAYSPYWIDLKRKAGCNADNAKIATDFRQFLTGC